MNKKIFMIIVFLIAIPQLQAEENGAENDLLHNPYLLENARFIALAEEAYAEDRYADAINYAEEAIKNARLSDEFVALQMKIRETNEAIGAARTRLDRTKIIQELYAETYEKAETAFAEALDARSREDWDKACEAALLVVAILADLPTPLPAQYLVKTWKSARDCLWNIAGKPEIYGDPNQWRVIYNANRSKFPRANEPNLITPGMILDIPSIKGELRIGILEGE